MMMIIIMHLPRPSHRLRPPPPPPPLNMYAGLQIRQKLLCHLQKLLPLFMAYTFARSVGVALYNDGYVT